MGFSTQYEYDPNGNLISKLDANGNTTTYTYDKLNRLTNRSYTEGSDTYEYDWRGNLTRCFNEHIEYLYTYDSLNRVLSKTVLPWKKQISYTYDGKGNRTSMTDPDGGITTYEYDKNNRLIRLENPFDQTTTFEYDSAGRMTRQNNANGTFALYIHDASDNLTSLTHYKSTGDTIAFFTYTYDSVGFRTKMRDLEGLHTYRFDRAGRLVHVTYANGNTEEYQYDGAGNRMMLIENEADTTRYGYDAADRILFAGSTTFGFDGNGNLAIEIDMEGQNSYGYNSKNELEKINSNLSDTIFYFYDPNGYRISTRYKTDSIINYFFDGPNILQEFSNDGYIFKQYTSNLNFDNWLSLSANNQIYIYHQDGILSNLAITDSSEFVINRYFFYPYGQFETINESIENSLLFTGRYYEKTSKNYYYRSRFYNQEIGQFQSKDIFPNFLKVPLSLNKYLYVQDNPINFIDPTGYARVGTKDMGLPFCEYNKGKGYCRHEHIFYDDGTNSGFFPYEFKDDENIKFYDFDRYPGIYDDKTLRKAEENVQGRWRFRFKTYCLIANDCKDYIREVLEEYGNLGGEVSNSPPHGHQDGSHPNGENTPVDSTEIVRPRDPNELIAPAGYNPLNHWISRDATLPYSILFENDPDLGAVVAAQQVEITLPIDPHLDPFSFKLGDFGFANFYFPITQDITHYQARLDVSDSLGVWVDVDFGIETRGGYAYWRFVTIDPETGEPTREVRDGFLPVNDSLNRRGEGFVNFKIRPESTSETFDKIEPQASIVFDTEEPVLTPYVFNTIDANSPSSFLKPEVWAPDSTSLQISWNGEDVGSGVSGYDVFYSEANEPFTLWLDNTPANSAIFPARLGKEYCFIIRSGDFVGNIGKLSDECDLSFIFTEDLIVSSQEDIPGLNNSSNLILGQNFPNPFSQTTYIPYELKQAGLVEIKLFTLEGKFIKGLVGELQRPGNHGVLWDGTNQTGSRVASGVYLYQLHVNGRVNSRKMILIR